MLRTFYSFFFFHIAKFPMRNSLPTCTSLTAQVLILLASPTVAENTSLLFCYFFVTIKVGLFIYLFTLWFSFLNSCLYIYFFLDCSCFFLLCHSCLYFNPWAHKQVTDTVPFGIHLLAVSCCSSAGPRQVHTAELLEWDANRKQKRARNSEQKLRNPAALNIRSYQKAHIWANSTSHYRHCQVYWTCGHVRALGAGGMA